MSAANARLDLVPMDLLRPSRHNPRIFRDDDPHLAELAESIRAVGLLSPVLIRPVNGGGMAYELVAGERRFRAAKLAGLDRIPAIVRQDLDERAAMELTVTENLQREDLHPLEEANGVAVLLDNGHSAQDVADRLGKSMGWVAKRARLSTLVWTWRKLATDPEHAVSRWPVANLELIARLEPAAQDAFFNELDDERAFSDEWHMHELAQPRVLRRALAGYTQLLRVAPWKLDDDTLVPSAGACSACPKRSSCQPGLFDDEDDEAPAGKRVRSGDRCLDSECWSAKGRTLLRQVVVSLEVSGSTVYLEQANAGSNGFELPSELTKGRRLVFPGWGQKAKKSDPDAVAVVRADGPLAGSVRWATFDVEPDLDGGAMKRRGAAAAGGEQSPAESLATKRAALEAKRRLHVVRAICGRLQPTDSGVEPIEVRMDRRELLAMLVTFGTHRNGVGYSSMYPLEAFSADGGTNPYPGRNARCEFEAAFHKQLPDLERWLARSVAVVLDARWRSYGKDSPVTDPVWDEVRYFTDTVLGLDVDELMAAAVVALPEPKSWAKLEAKVEAKS